MTQDTTHDIEKIDDPVHVNIGTFDCSQPAYDIRLDVFKIDEDETIQLKLHCTTRASAANVFNRIYKSLVYIFTGKFDMEFVFDFTGDKQIDERLNAVKSVVGRIKRQADKWRWKF